jgi:uncharacterized membrane protein YfcA
LTGMAIGFAVHDKMNPQTFKKGTLIVLTLTGLNLLYKAATV